MKPVAYDSLAATPWKNGGGVPRELACYPAGAGFDDFLWRVSIADVQQSGPFSRFPGIGRVILLLDGEGMLLRGEAGEHALTEALVPYAFDGAAQIDAQLLSPSRDFNLMLRRGRAEGSVAVLRASAQLAPAGKQLLFCVNGSWQIDGDCILHRGDHVLTDSALHASMLEAGALLCAVVKLT
jgi:environmental stress-induced protein Ves